MINLNSINLGSLNLGGMNTSEIKLGYPSSGCPIAGLKGLQGLYMGKGLTNEMMSRDPIWRDKSGKGNHIALKNFGWGSSSGVGLYAYDFKTNLFDYRGPSIGSEKHSDRFIITKAISGQVNIQYKNTIFKCKIKVSGINEAIDRGEITSLRIYNSANSSIGVILKNDGVYNIDIVGSSGYIYFYATGRFANAVDLQTPIIIEQIPDYDGAICFDGVDDFGETIKDLNFTDNYSVVSLVVPFYRTQNQVMFGKNYLKDVYCNYSTSLSFYSAGKSVYIGGGSLSTNKVRLLVCRRNESIQEIKDVISGIAKSDIPNSVIDNPGKYYMGRSQAVYNYGQFAMFAHAIFDHYISDEELQILSDYWKKEFPELLPDQAWTVTGKTNSDADRATIKNITGNGNDLTLTNVGYAENSGYGKWPFRMNPETTIFKGQPYGTGHFTADGSTYAVTITGGLNSVRFKFRVREMQEGAKFTIRCRSASATLKEFATTENGIYEFEYENPDETFILLFYNGVLGSGVYWDFYVDILQDPDYEGYLLTDGVDDSIVSSTFDLSENWTMVGDWKMLDSATLSPVISKSSSFVLEYIDALFYVYIKNPNTAKIINGVNSIKAICSDGRLYLHDGTEIIDDNLKTYKGGISPIYIGITKGGTKLSKIAFKNLAIYNNAILTKEQCIRAYNYLQTIKNN